VCESIKMKLTGSSLIPVSIREHHHSWNARTCVRAKAGVVIERDRSGCAAIHDGRQREVRSIRPSSALSAYAAAAVIVHVVCLVGIARTAARKICHSEAVHEETTTEAVCNVNIWRSLAGEQ
jgi:hypothetical protein